MCTGTGFSVWRLGWCHGSQEALGFHLLITLRLLLQAERTRRTGGADNRRMRGQEDKTEDKEDQRNRWQEEKRRGGWGQKKRRIERTWGGKREELLCDWEMTWETTTTTPTHTPPPSHPSTSLIPLFLRSWTVQLELMFIYWVVEKCQESAASHLPNPQGNERRSPGDLPLLLLMGFLQGSSQETSTC